MDPTTVLTLVIVVVAAGLGWYFWRGPQGAGQAPATPSATPSADSTSPTTGGDEPYEEEEPKGPRPGEMPRPNLEDPKVAKADALVHKWFTERLAGPRGMDKATRDAAVDQLVREQGATPGLAAIVLYDRELKRRGQSPKRPPVEVREAMRTLGLKR